METFGGLENISEYSRINMTIALTNGVWGVGGSGEGGTRASVHPAAPWKKRAAAPPLRTVQPPVGVLEEVIFRLGPMDVCLSGLLVSRWSNFISYLQH